MLLPQDQSFAHQTVLHHIYREKREKASFIYRFLDAVIVITIDSISLIYRYRWKTFYFIIVMIAGDMTGAYSVHTIYEGHEIMFHVSTMLPYSKDNKQQVNQLLNYS